MKPTLSNRIRAAAFTLVELIIVIGIIAILAAMIFPAFSSIKRKMHVKKVQAELQKLETAIQAYKTKYGHYPPDNRQADGTAANRQYYGLNPLYYELKGTKLNGNDYQTLDNRITLATTAVPTVFGNGVSGFINCTRGNADETSPAQDFLKDLAPAQFVVGKVSGTETAVLVCSVQWSKELASVMSGFTPNTEGVYPNPWRYDSSSPTNNPGEFDLWVDLVQSGKTNRISNWSTRPQVVYDGP